MLSELYLLWKIISTDFYDTQQLTSCHYLFSLRKQIQEKEPMTVYSLKHGFDCVWGGFRMVPHKTHRGTRAMQRLKCFEGIPAPYDKVKRVVVPKALRVTRLGFKSRYCVLADLSESVSPLLACGWLSLELVSNEQSCRNINNLAWNQWIFIEWGLHWKNISYYFCCKWWSPRDSCLVNEEKQMMNLSNNATLVDVLCMMYSCFVSRSLTLLSVMFVGWLEIQKNCAGIRGKAKGRW